jgi:hypothetical protein
MKHTMTKVASCRFPLGGQSMSQLMPSRAAVAKMQEISEGLAKATGVAPEEVMKILRYLNIEGSLAHREYKVAQVKQFGIPQEVFTIENISLQNVRIATSEVPL